MKSKAEETNGNLTVFIFSLAIRREFVSPNLPQICTIVVLN